MKKADARGQEREERDPRKLSSEKVRGSGVVKKNAHCENDNRRSLLSAARALRFVLSTTPPPRPPLYKADTLVVLPQDKYVRLF